MIAAPTPFSNPVPEEMRRLTARAGVGFGLGSWRLKVGVSIAVVVAGLVLVILPWRSQTPPVFPPETPRVVSSPPQASTPVAPTAAPIVSAPVPVAQPPKPSSANEASDPGRSTAAPDLPPKTKEIRPTPQNEPRSKQTRGALVEQQRADAERERLASRKREEEAEQARLAAARAQQEANQRAATAEQARVAALQRQQAEAEQARNQMTTAKRAAEQAGADQHAPKLLAFGQTKERDGLAALARSDYDAAGRLLREAQSDYQSAAQEAKREVEMERRSVAMLKSSAEQARTRTATRREQAVKAEADRLAKSIFDLAQAKQIEADGLVSGQNFAAASQAYQDAAEKYMEAAMRAQTFREAKAQADSARARMLTEKQKGKQDSAEFNTGLAEERQANSLYEQLAFKEAAEKFRAAETLFNRAATAAKQGSSRPTPPF